jgi:hypothetical protein
VGRRRPASASWDGSGADDWLLIELMVVVSLIVRLACLAMAGYRGAATLAREARPL